MEATSQSSASTQRSSTLVHKSALWRPAFALLLCQLLQHLWFALFLHDPRHLGPHAISFLGDVLLVAALVIPLDLLARRFTRGAFSQLVSTGGMILLFVAAIPLTLYPRTLLEFMAFPANVFSADADSAGQFLVSYLGVAAWACLIPVSAAMLASLWLPRFPSLRTHPLLVFALLVGAVLSMIRPSPNPILYGVRETAIDLLMGEKRLVPRLNNHSHPARSSAAAFANATYATRFASKTDPSRNHLVVVVLESITAQAFEKEFLTRKSGFYDKYGKDISYFSNYHSTNLDSYTSLIAMTTSVMVPFRAYAAPDRYVSVNGAPNMVRSLQDQGFKSLFISTYEEQPFVPNAKDWSQIKDRREIPGIEKWLSVGRSRMESASEDLAALPIVLDFSRSSRQSLVMQEMVFGHSPEWQIRKNESPLAYYDEYLEKLVLGLQQADLARDTLLVVVSDHGERFRAGDVKNYRVPLFVWGEGMGREDDAAFRSHLSFQAIVAHFLQGTPLPKEEESIFTVGSTERWVYGQILASGDSAFIDDGRGTLLDKGTRLDAKGLHDSFQDNLDAFVARYAKE